MNRRVTGSAVALLCAIATQVAGAAPVTVTDDRGVRVTFAQSPRRIVSMLPSITESVCGLGACDRLVGTDRFSDWPSSVLPLPKLGGLDDPQVERIVALKPDVVLLSKSARVADRLSALGLTVVVLDSQNHGDVKRSVEVLARLLGTPAEGARLWSSIERDLAVAAARVPQAVRGQRVYFEIASAPYAAGSASFIGETLTRLAMDNIVPAALGPFPRLNPEFVVRADPDIVMASRRELAALAERPGWQGLEALKRGRTCGFDSAQYLVLIRPGPRLGEAALSLADCLAALPVQAR